MSNTVSWTWCSHTDVTACAGIAGSSLDLLLMIVLNFLHAQTQEEGMSLLAKYVLSSQLGCNF